MIVIASSNGKPLCTHYYIYNKSVKLYVPHLYVEVLRKPTKKDIDITAHAYA